MADFVSFDSIRLLARAVLDGTRGALARYRNILCYGQFRELALRDDGTGHRNTCVTVKNGRDIDGVSDSPFPFGFGPALLASGSGRAHGKRGRP